MQAWRGTTVQGAHPININPVGLRAEAVEKGIVLWEPFAGVGCSVLVACLEAGLTVVNYIWQDTCPLAKRVAATLLPKLMQRFPGQLPASAIKGFDRKLPADIKLTSAMMLANLGQIDVVVGGWECQSMSRAGKRGGMEDARGTCGSGHDTPRYTFWRTHSRGQCLMLGSVTLSGR